MPQSELPLMECAQGQHHPWQCAPSLSTKTSRGSGTTGKAGEQRLDAQQVSERALLDRPDGFTELTAGQFWADAETPPRTLPDRSP